MRARNWLCALLFLALIVSLITVKGNAAAVATASVSPATITKAVGETFSINLTAANFPDKLWGYQFRIDYNNQILTALNYTNLAELLYSPFNIDESSTINNTAGWVYASYHAPMGDQVGVSITAATPLLTITFRVDANGSSTLVNDESDIGTRFVTIHGDAIIPPYNLNVNNGYFSTSAVQLHDVSITGLTVNPSTAHPGATLSIAVTVKNTGSFNETFPVTAKFNETQLTLTTIGTQTVTNLAPDASTTVTFSWDTTGVVEGKYIVRADATVSNDAFPSDNTQTSGTINLSESTTTGLTNTILYVGIGLIVIIVIIVAVYLLRRRKH